MRQMLGAAGILLARPLAGQAAVPRQRRALNAPLTQAEAVLWAAGDISRYYPSQARYIRYLTIYHVPEDEREAVVKVLAFHLNMISAASDIVPWKSLVVPGTKDSLLRVNLLDLQSVDGRFGPQIEVWEKFADVDTLFHIRLKKERVTVPTAAKAAQKVKVRSRNRNNRWEYFDGQKWLSRESWEREYNESAPRWQHRAKPKIRARVVRTITSAAPWVSNTRELVKAQAYLAKATESKELSYGSRATVLDGLWFLYQTAVQSERSADNPGYYQMLGIRNQHDYERLVAFNARVLVNRRPVLEAVARSGVARQPRRISREDVGYWRTFDNKTAVNLNNPLRVLNGELKFNAVEAFGTLPNGLWATALFAGNDPLGGAKAGDLQDSAPDFVGFDRTTSSNNGRIEVYLSCIRCHNDGGLRDIERPFARDTFRKPFQLQSPIHRKFIELRQNYLRSYLPLFERDRRRYQLALYEVNGWEPKAMARELKETWREYVDRPVYTPRAAAMLGVTEKQFQAAVLRTVKPTDGGQGSVDTPLASYGRDEKESKANALSYDQWLEAFPLAQFVLSGQQPLEFVPPRGDKVFQGRKQRAAR